MDTNPENRPHRSFFQFGRSAAIGVPADTPPALLRRSSNSSSSINFPANTMGTNVSSTDDPAAQSNPSDSNHPNEPYIPSKTDCSRVLITLTKHLPPASRLPLELAYEIIDLAEYYPTVFARSTADWRISVSASSGRGARYVGCKAVVVTDPIPAGAKKVKRIVFWTKSRDQGWSGEAADTRGTYRASYTWFEAAILRPRSGDPNTPCRIADEVRKNGLTDVTDPNRPFPETGWELVPQPYNKEGNWRVQLNKGSWTHEEEHIVEWNGNEKFPGGSEPDTKNDWELETGHGRGVGFLKSLKPGDRVVLLAKAQFPGWVNNVQGATVEITWIPL